MGTCSVAADAVIKVDGDVRVAENATLDAQSAPATITVRGDVFSGPGSLLGLGCQPPSYVGNSGHASTVEPDGHSTIMIKGNVTAIDASTVLLNGVEVRGNVTLLGGGAYIPWSIKNNTIGRNLVCAKLSPGVSGGFVPGAVNIVGGNALGQCASLV